MAQHDYVIDNASGATVRADINSALSAIQSLNSGTSAPSSTAAGMLWLDTTGGAPYALKVRDAGNNHWLTLASVTDPGSDGNLSVSAIEGTNVLSTGESGGSKFLREDGDGSCSFQSAIESNQILQHKHVLLTGLSQQDHQSTTEASTSVTASITPKETGSKIHVIFNFYSGLIVNSSAGLEGTQRIKRTGSSVTDDFIGSVTEHNMYFESGVRTSNAQNNFPYTLSVVDTPGHSNTTDAITYTLHVNAGVAGSGTLAVRLFRGGNGTANLTFLEIKG